MFVGAYSFRSITYFNYGFKQDLVSIYHHRHCSGSYPDDGRR